MSFGQAGVLNISHRGTNLPRDYEYGTEMSMKNQY